MAGTARGEEFHAVLLAGGSGTRFWPLSRENFPKQFLALGGKEPLLVGTWKRLRALVSRDRAWVVAPAPLARPIRRMLPELRPSRLLLEPAPRDTAAAIGLACSKIARRSPEAIVGVFPTDHRVRDLPAFVRAVRKAIAVAAEGNLVCLGIRPDRPATGFGYLRCARRPGGPAAVPVERFVEKPDEARARRYLRSGRYLWNGGMFVWKARRYLEELGRCAPGILRGVQAAVAGRTALWHRLPKISVDYAVMEKASGVWVVPLDAGWDDVGSWDAAARLREEAGLRDPKVFLFESPGSVVFGKDRVVAVVGLPGAVVVDAEDALLVLARRRAEAVREVVAELRRRGLEKLL